MLKELMHDPIFLARKSDAATKEDLQAAQNLPDTSTAHKDNRVVMAATMIGVGKRYQSIIGPWSCKPALRPTPAGQRRSFSTKWIIVPGY